jgi:hypothetical protein
MNHSRLRRRWKGASYPGLEIIGKLAAALEVEPAELLRVPGPKDDLGRYRNKLNG